MGLTVALVVAVVVGVVFGVDPDLDLKIAGLFFSPRTNLFAVDFQPWVEVVRDGAEALIALLVAPAILALIGKVVWPDSRMFVRGRAALFLVLTLILGPGVLTNGLLKTYWERARPIDVVQFKGTDPFTPWWDPVGPCPANCSFIAGEPSGAFWTLAPASLAPPQWRLLAYGGALAFGVAMGLMRMAAGGHFFTDVAFAGVFTFLLIWLVHGLIFRWQATWMSDDAVELPLARAGFALRRGLAAVVRRVGRQTGKSS